MTCIHGGQVGLCRQCEHEGPRLGADPRDARIAELERLCNGEMELREHVAAERDRMAVRVHELEARAKQNLEIKKLFADKCDRLTAETNRWQDVANEAAANYWRLTDERTRLRGALDAVHMDSVACAPESGPKQYCITEWALSKVREALAYVADTPPRITEGDTPSRMPDPTEHAALLRVAEAAERFVAGPYEGSTFGERNNALVDSLADLRRARAGKDGGSDG